MAKFYSEISLLFDEVFEFEKQILLGTSTYYKSFVLKICFKTWKIEYIRKIWQNINQFCSALSALENLEIC